MEISVARGFLGAGMVLGISSRPELNLDEEEKKILHHASMLLVQLLNEKMLQGISIIEIAE